MTDNLTNTKSLLALFEVYDERKSVSIVSLRIQRLSLLIVTAAAAAAAVSVINCSPCHANKRSRSSLNNKAPSAHLALVSAAVPADYLSLEAYSSCGRTPSVPAVGLGLRFSFGSSLCTPISEDGPYHLCSDLVAVVHWLYPEQFSRIVAVCTV